MSKASGKETHLGPEGLYIAATLPSLDQASPPLQELWEPAALTGWIQVDSITLELDTN